MTLLADFPVGRWILAAAAALVLGGAAHAEINPPDCKFNGIYIYLGVDKQVAHVGDQVFYSLVIGNGDFPSCRAQQIAASITTPDGVVHPLTLSRTTLNPGESDSYENVVSYFIRSQDVRDHLVVGSAKLTAVINQNIVNENATSSKEVNTVVVNPSLSIEANCQGGAGEFAPISVNGTVRNTGDILLNNVTVTNALNGERILGPISLGVGQSAPFNGSFIPTTACRGNADLVARGTDAVLDGDLLTPKTVSASTTVSCSNSTRPEIRVFKECPAVPPLAGSVLTYLGTVQNVGNVTLTNVTVFSDRPAGNTIVFTRALLAPGEQATFQGSYPTPLDACSVTDTLRATGQDRCSSQTVTDTETSSCPLAVAGSLTVTVNCPQNPPAAGSTIQYSGTVRNTGTVTLRNVVVVNEASPQQPVLRVDSLPPNATANFNASANVPGTGCVVGATFAASADDRCGGSVPTHRVSLECPIATQPGLTISHECPTVTPGPGSSATVSGIVRNSGNVTLTEVIVQSGGVTVFGPVQLEPGQSLPLTVSLPVPLDRCSFETTLVASGRDVCSARLTSSSSSRSCPVKTSPSLVLTKECPPSPPVAGTLLVQSGSLVNNGDVALNDVTVSSGVNRILGPMTLAPGASTNFTYSIIAPSGVCEFTDTWNASGRDPCTAQQISRTATTRCPVLTTPQIAVTVTCPTEVLIPGAIARYSGRVSNVGNITLTNVLVVDSANPGTVVFSQPALAPGASAAFSIAKTVPSNTCSLALELAATGLSECNGEPTGSSAGTTCPVVSSPALTVVHECPSEPGIPGFPSTFGGRVSNTGNITLTNVTVSATEFGSTLRVFGPATLEPGASASFSGTYGVPVSATGCTYESRVFAAGNDRCTGAEVVAENTSRCALSTLPGIEVVFRCPTTVVASGLTATYSGTVRNIGNVTLNSIRVVNSLTGDSTVFSRPSLVPGESVEFTGTYPVPTNCCTVTSTLSVTAMDDCSQQAVSDTSTGTCPILYSSNIEVTKVCPTQTVEPGDSLSFSGTVSNPGDITLEDVHVYHEVAGTTNVVVGPITLVPGQTVTYRTRFIVPVDYCDDVVTATGRALCPGSEPVTASVNTACPVLLTPMIMVEQQCPSVPASAGGLFTFTGTVWNAGNVTLTNVFVYNSMPISGTRLIGPITLVPGASSRFTGSYTVDGGCCETLDVLTATGLDRCSGQSVENTASSVCPLESSPALSIRKFCGPGQAFTGTVTNTGDITLTNVVVVANTGSTSQRLLGPIELAPGESARFEGSAPESTVVGATGISLCRAEPVAALADCSGPIDSIIQVTGLTESALGYTLTWTSIPGQRYRLQYRDQLTDPTWKDVPGDVVATGITSEKTDGDTDERMRLYRVSRIE